MHRWSPTRWHYKGPMVPGFTTGMGFHRCRHPCTISCVHWLAHCLQLQVQSELTSQNTGISKVRIFSNQLPGITWVHGVSHHSSFLKSWVGVLAECMVEPQAGCSFRQHLNIAITCGSSASLMGSVPSTPYLICNFLLVLSFICLFIISINCCWLKNS